MKEKYELERRNTQIPIDLAANVLCSTVRNTLVIGLIRDYHLSQKKVSEIFGIKQQAVSNYIRGIRGVNKELMKIRAFSDNIKLMANEINNGTSSDDLILLINGICMKLIADKNIRLAISEWKNRHRLSDKFTSSQ